MSFLLGHSHPPPPLTAAAMLRWNPRAESAGKPKAWGAGKPKAWGSCGGREGAHDTTGARSGTTKAREQRAAAILPRPSATQARIGCRSVRGVICSTERGFMQPPPGARWLQHACRNLAAGWRHMQTMVLVSGDYTQGHQCHESIQLTTLSLGRNSELALPLLYEPLRLAPLSLLPPPLLLPLPLLLRPDALLPTDIGQPEQLGYVHHRRPRRRLWFTLPPPAARNLC